MTNREAADLRREVSQLRSEVEWLRAQIAIAPSTITFPAQTPIRLSPTTWSSGTTISVSHLSSS